MKKKVQFSLLGWSILCLLGLATTAQTTVNKAYPQHYFRLPMDLPPSIIGTFGDFRKNHFHSGLDYRTNRREGYPVYAAADGWISRLKVQISGFGNAVYIDHPNGYTSLYAHLQRFNERIAQQVKDAQYQTSSFEIDLPIFSDAIPVKKGQIIGWSGNTGGSSGPHLHFEIRDTKTEEIINPQLFGLAIPDKIKPEIEGIYIYQTQGQPFSERTSKRFISTSGTNGTYRLTQQTPIKFAGEIGFGIIAFDRSTAGESKHSVYATELFIDGKIIYSSIWERFSFDHSRAINAYVDYPSLITSGKWVQKNFIEPANPLKVYPSAINRGLFSPTDKQIHHVEYRLKDIQGNISRLNFNIQAEELQSTRESTSLKPTAYFQYDQPNSFGTDIMRLSIPKGALYSDLGFYYSTGPKPGNAYSNIYYVHNKLTPVQDTLSLWIKLDASCPEALKSKTVLVNEKKEAQSSHYEDGYLKATIKAFGGFYALVDTIAPSIVSVNISQGKSMKDLPKIAFKIKDNLAGIKDFRGAIDNKWILMEYDAKSNSLWHTFDSRTASGKHYFTLDVSDKMENTSRFQASFER